MSKKKVLLITQEMQPYTMLSDISNVMRKLPQKVQQEGMEIRVLMPRYGTINERRHRLHEVVRLSGMNIVVHDDDYPLIIKVASLPGARLQVYFLDNDEFFRRKSLFRDDEDQPHTDNLDRAIFFCKGAIETVRKFGWPPDIIHCHGWMTAFIPCYVRTAYKNEPIFKNSKIIYSAYNSSMEESLALDQLDSGVIQSMKSADLDPYRGSDAIRLDRGAMHYADAIVQGSTELSNDAQSALEGSEAPQLVAEPGTELTAYTEFYSELLEKKK